MTDEKIGCQYGLWDSPISPISLARVMRFEDVAWDDSGTLVWLEKRSNRGVLMVQPPGGEAMRELNSEFSVRAKLGYGGGDFCVGHGNVYFVEAGSRRIYRQPLASGVACPVTPAFGSSASPKLSPDGRWLMFVRSYEEQDTLEIVDAGGKYWPQKLVSGNDFYMQPAWHPDGQRIAWIAWNHPNMPWDGTQLHIGKLRVGEDFLPTLIEEKTVAGDVETSILQPEFSPDGRYLAYINDETGWWQLYLYDLSSGEVRQVTDALAEHGHPAWIQGLRTYGFGSDGKTLFFLRNESGFICPWQIDLSSGKEQRLLLDGGYTFLDQISVREDNLALIASGGRQPPRVITYRPADDGSSGDTHVNRRGTSEELPENAYSKPMAIEWLGMDGGTVHGLYYPPHNERFEGVGTPPLIVHIHGGPTSQTRDKFNLTAQFFTSRGYAVLEVNYRGSTGYGRVYRDKLRGNWGVYDVEDTVSGARHLVEGGLVDEKRLTIMGGSAGGFTVLKALEDYPGFFAAGICLYGVSNQFTSAADTHKFEAHYSDSLLGTLPETSDLYRERSPIFFVDKIQDPIAIFQGEDDVVVPRLQSDEVVESLQKRGVPHVYHVYPGEGHGFRKSETIEHFYSEVEKFLRQYVIFS